MSFLRFLFFITFLALTYSSQVDAENNIYFSVNAPGTKPYLYFNQELKKYQGIVVDFFDSMEPQNSFSVEYIDTSRNRYESTLLNNQADLFLSAVDWLTAPESYLISDTIALNISYLYSVNPFQVGFELDGSEQATICTRSNFIYPKLDELFKLDKLTRVDSLDHSTMTSMLIRGRCDYLILGKEDAIAELFHPKYCNQTFFESSQVIHSVKMVFVIRNDRQDIKERLNNHLKIFVGNGLLDASFKRHSGLHSFPKESC